MLKETMYSAFEENNNISPAYMEKFGVKRGLRNADGTGVMAGVTNICNVHGYVVDDGEKKPIEGNLIFRGYNIRDIIDNVMLRSYKKGKTEFLDRKQPRALAEEIIDELEVVTPSATTPVRRLSGGNVQKVLVGREISLNPRVLMVAYPVRGLDINSSYMIYNLLSKQKAQGVSVIFVGEDLDVLIDLCDRIMVINSGTITGIVNGKEAKKEELGLLMTKSTDEEVAEDA